MTNSSQSVTASLTPSAFGQTVASSGSSTSAYGFGATSAYGFGATSGYRNDGDAGLTLVGCRYYDAQVGRFITRDTYLDQAPYAYCDGDPVNYVDPTGHSDLGYYTAFLFVAIFVAIVVVANPVAGAAFLGSPAGILIIAGLASLGGALGDHLSDAIDEANKERDDRVREDQAKSTVAPQ